MMIKYIFTATAAIGCLLSGSAGAATASTSSVAAKAAFTAAATATSTTDCYGHVIQLVATDGGILYIYTDGGVLGVVPPGDANYAGDMALATSALMGGKQVFVRLYGTSCNVGSFTQVEGVMLSSSN